jgi:hypothetical protein
MPVTGLPLAAEASLNALLSSNAVSSWKIVGGEGDSTVIVFRLRPASQSTTTNMAASYVINKPATVHYRKKPPSQLKRDIKRAAQRQQPHQVSEKKASGIENCDGENSAILPLLETEEHRPIDSVEEVRPMATSPLPSCTELTDDVFSGEPRPGIPLTQDLFTSSCIGGTVSHTGKESDFSPITVIDYVSALSDKSVHGHLKDRRRNKGFSRCVLVQRDKCDVLVFESDDLVMEYDCKDEGRNSYWFVKQSPRNMLTLENEKLTDLRRGKPPFRVTEYQLIRARAEQDLSSG